MSFPRTLHVLAMAAALLPAFLTSACTKKITNPPANDIGTLIDRAGELDDPPVFHNDSTVATQDSTAASGEIWSCTETTHRVADAPAEFPTFDPNAEAIWPGATVQGGTVSSPTPDRILAPRGGGSVILNNNTGAMISSVDIREVTQAAVVSAANTIIAAQPTKFPARLSIAIDEVQSAQELALKLHANASFFGLFESSANFDFGENDHFNRFLVQLHQSFYTLVFERPPHLSDFWAPSVTAVDLQPFVSRGNPPLYVGSVTSGRMFFLLIASTESADSMASSVNASFFGFGGGGSVKHVSQLANLRVRAFALGGDANAAIDAVRGGLISLDNFLAELRNGNVLGTAVPLSYTARSVRSDKLVSNAVAYDYSTRDCAPEGPAGACQPLPVAETFVPPDGGGGGNPYTDPDGLTTGDHATKVVVGLRVDYGRLLDRIIAIYRTINSDYSLGPLSYGDVHGNGGGGDVKGLDLLAPDGWVATGMNLRTGDEVDQVQLVFREWRGCAGLGRVERTSAVAGGTGGLPHTERASGNEFVCGIHGRSGYRNDALGPIYAVHPGDHGPPLVPFSAVSWLRGPMERHAGHGSN